VQVSLEGLKETNDKIRGVGSFKKVITAIESLKKNHIEVRASLTLTRMNVGEIRDLGIYLKKIGVSKFAIRRYSSAGQGRQLEEAMLSPMEVKKYYEMRDKIKEELEDLPRFIISSNCEDAIYTATRTDSLGSHQVVCGLITGHNFTIFTNGDVLACRRCPIVAGNVLKDNLLDIYFTFDTLWKLRNLDNAHDLCKKCAYFKYCFGGAKCLAYFYFDNPMAPDPQCFHLFEKSPKKERHGIAQRDFLNSIGA